jgi:site-specific recombinase XerD
MEKGRKERTLHFCQTTVKTLAAYLRSRAYDSKAFLFPARRDKKTAYPLTANGLLELIERPGKASGITAARCLPHTFRHTFAVEFLRAGGNVFTLQQLMGHTSLAVTQWYFALAQADIENQHR